MQCGRTVSAWISLKNCWQNCSAQDVCSFVLHLSSISGWNFLLRRCTTTVMLTALRSTDPVTLIIGFVVVLTMNHKWLSHTTTDYRVHVKHASAHIDTSAHTEALGGQLCYIIWQLTTAEICLSKLKVLAWVSSRFAETRLAETHFAASWKSTCSMQLFCGKKSYSVSLITFLVRTLSYCN